MTYYPQQDGEWLQPKLGYRMACCDCGLVHRMQFRIKAGKVQFRAWRDNRATGQRRVKLPDRLKRALLAMDNFQK